MTVPYLIYHNHHLSPPPLTLRLFSWSLLIESQIIQYLARKSIVTARRGQLLTELIALDTVRMCIVIQKNNVYINV